MPRTSTAEANKPQAAATPPAGLTTLEQHLAWLQMLAAPGTDIRPVAENLCREKFALLGALEEVREHHKQLRQEIEALCEPERYPAVITDVQRNGETTVEVHGAGMLLQVGVHPDVDPDELRVGARAVLTKGRDC